MKTIRQVEIKSVFSDSLPEIIDMQESTLYVSEKYNGCSHLCLWGCGVQCYLPLNKDGWTLVKDKDKVSITPSILQRFACKSHYIITNNKANFV